MTAAASASRFVPHPESRRGTNRDANQQEGA
jgi:hypothetical protein